MENGFAVDAISQTPPPGQPAQNRAWQPLTPRGVAFFARAGMGRLLAVQGIFALFAALSASWFLFTAWFPLVGKAIAQLPPEGKIQAGVLDWRGPPAQVLAENRFLGIAVDLDREGALRPWADVRLEMGRRTLRATSIAGQIEWPYPRRWMLRFNRAELEPLWGAWSPWIQLLTAAALMLGLPLSWAVASLFYTLPALAFKASLRRRAGVLGVFKLAGAAQMPGSLLLTLSVAGYRAGAIGLATLAAAFGMHLALSWIYLALSVAWLPKRSASAAAKNPFKKSVPETPALPTDDSNPFKKPGSAQRDAGQADA